MIEEVQRFTKPLQPIVDFFNAEVPELDQVGVHISLRTIMDATGEGNGEIGPILDAIAFINNLPTNPSGHGLLSLGDFSFDASNLGDVLSGDPSRLKVPGNIVPPSNLLEQADGMSDGFFSMAASMGGGSGFSFPIVTDPVHSAWQLLAGGTPDLITYTMPDFSKSAGAEVQANFGVFEVHLNADITFTAALRLGYDTNGLREFVNSGNPTDLLDGLYVNTLHTGLTLTGDVDVGAGLLGVTLDGGITANGVITFAGTAGSTKAYAGAILNEPLSHVFTASGDISASLDLSYGFDTPLGRIDLFSINLAQATLLDFNTAVNERPSDTASPHRHDRHRHPERRADGPRLDHHTEQLL